MAVRQGLSRSSGPDRTLQPGGTTPLAARPDTNTVGIGARAAETRHMFLNLGPSHPAMHGIIQLIVELDGERVVGADLEIGYLHRGFEKESERGPYNNVIPYTDRLNYVSPLINNFGYCLAVERLLGIEATEIGRASCRERVYVLV